MTSRQVLIVGARIPVSSRLEGEDAENGLLALVCKHEGVNPPFFAGGPVLVVVNRAYDSSEIEDFPAYLAWDMLTLPEDNMFSASQIEHIRSLTEQAGAEMPEAGAFRDLLDALGVDPQVLKFGLYSDHYDMDRCFDLYSASHEPYGEIDSYEVDKSEEEEDDQPAEKSD